MDVIRVIITSIFCYFLLSLTVLIVLPLIELIDFLESIGTVLPGIVNLILFSPFIVWYLAMPYIAYKAAIYNVGHNHDLWRSIVYAINDVRLYLALLPVIGRLFYNDSKDKSTRFQPTEQVSRIPLIPRIGD